MLTRLTLSDFRSYSHCQIQVPESALVFLVGPNGAGKTNMLEALSLLGGGRGLRGAQARDFIREGALTQAGAPAWAIAASVRRTPLIHEVSQALIYEGEGKFRRLSRLNKKASASAGEFAALLPTLSLSPQEDTLFRGPAEDRRVLLDRFVTASTPEHRGQVSAYQRAVRERNALLRQAQREGTPLNAAWLDGLEVQMASHGVAIASARRVLLEKLATAVAATSHPFPAARLALEGAMEAELATTNAFVVEANWREKWAQTRSQDLAAGRTCDGPHRSDLAVIYGPKDRPAAQVSTGEQKALLLSLFLGQVRVLAAQGVQPLLLLDEVAAHLDADRRGALMAELAALPAQTWMSGTDWATLKPPTQAVSVENYAHFRLENSALVL